MNQWNQPPAGGAPQAMPPQGGAWGQPMQFKFSLQKVPTRGVFNLEINARQAVVAPEALVLDGMSIPYHHIDDTEIRDQHLVILVNNGHYLDPTLVTWLEEERALVLQVRGSPPSRSRLPSIAMPPGTLPSGSGSSLRPRGGRPSSWRCPVPSVGPPSI